jgi:hypothetical protein
MENMALSFTARSLLFTALENFSGFPVVDHAAKIPGVSRREAIGRPAGDVIPGARLHIVAQNGKVMGAMGHTTIKDIDIVMNPHEEIKAIKLANLQYKAKLDTPRDSLNPLTNLAGFNKALQQVVPV